MISRKGSEIVSVSIAMCTYNGAKYIDEQLETIIAQDYPLHEIIVVDDRSSDDTFKILEEWQAKYPTLFKLCLNEKNLGFDKNFEKAISLCTGDLIAIADQDDIWMNDKLSSLAELFSNENVMLAHGASITLKNGSLHHFSGQLKRYKLFEGNDSRKLFLLNQLSGHNIMFRKSILNQAIPIPDFMPYDWWLALNATVLGEIKAIKKYLVHHRKHGDNAFFSKKRIKNPLTLLSRLLLFKQIQNLSSKSHLFLDEFIAHAKQHEQATESKIDWQFFKFLMKYSKIIFGHKKRIFPAFTFLTNSIKFAK
ncbi:glycosyltransferase [Pedobacter sp. LMG 31464]|uniref:Glycosyltransferase n=1 Tax=Pedobacter planticolens TaxID=2679964 RepID=A0A923IVM2_9SPHI|nr:glycosyltransferase [Pedobacter planticolens]MBB2147165.1 glycosyltransferase [Pedobacter planticolens]